MGRRSSTWGCTVVLPPPPKHGTFCSCGVWECDKLGVYCDRLASWTAKHDPLSVDLLAAFDAMASGHRAAARARASVAPAATSEATTTSGGAAAASSSPMPLRETGNGSAPANDSPRCAENVRRGQTLTQCSRKATRGLYCAQHSPSATTDDFESAPAGLEDVPDALPF